MFRCFIPLLRGHDMYGFYLNVRDEPVIESSTLSPLFIFVYFADILTFFWWTFFYHGNDGNINQNLEPKPTLSLFMIFTPSTSSKISILLGSPVGLRLRQIKLPSAAGTSGEQYGPHAVDVGDRHQSVTEESKVPWIERWSKTPGNAPNIAMEFSSTI